MTSIKLILEPLTKEAFSPFGDVLGGDQNAETESINYGLTNCHLQNSEVDTFDNDGGTVIRLFDTQPVTLPFKICVMERHRLGSQAFIAMDDNPFVLVVGEAGDFDPHSLSAFIARPDQIVNYHKGTWHHYCLALNAKTRFAVVDRNGPGTNCEEQHIVDNTEIYVDY